ncbi:lasso RiPP family leader peptide-containing protein [Rhodococcoides fascians A21d2]|nr:MULTISPECIES: lasso RiPP family leader peptide-containing protein [Rhodococcus]QII02909.1 lasso RiPP family leader peptide-containing protein [Rhodococcus fascians A21d2]
MTEDYQAPTIVDLGSFQDETGFGIGGQAEGWNPIADRKN